MNRVTNIKISSIKVNTTSLFMTDDKDIAKMNNVIDEYNQNDHTISENTFYNDLRYLSLVFKVLLECTDEKKSEHCITFYIHKDEVDKLHKF